MGAQEIIEAIKSYASLEKIQICCLHKRCSLNFDCAKPQTSMVYNFDAVKDKYKRDNHIDPPKSADAITSKNEKLIYIEFKSWKDYLERQRNINVENIQEQASKYATIMKLIDSVKISRHICDSAFFDDSENILYVLSTDLEDDYMKHIASRIYNLADVSSKLSHVCNTILEAKLKENFKDVEYKYHHVSCHKLDAYLESI